MLRDMGEHRLKGLVNLEHLWQMVASDLQQDFPPLKSLNAIPSNLPVHLTSFIGREHEITEIKRDLSGHRLVTLTGSGGTGKTRLSLQVAAEVLDSFTQGVWFVELAPLADPELIPQTILSVIGVSEQQGKAPLDVLKDYLHDKKVLLVLDNCEHLIEASAKVVNALLGPCRRFGFWPRAAKHSASEAKWRIMCPHCRCQTRSICPRSNNSRNMKRYGCSSTALCWWLHTLT